MENHTSSSIVRFFHSWPHITFSLTVLSEGKYSFTNPTYFETLAMVALMALLWLILTMIVFVIYICCAKSRRNSESSYNTKGCYCSVCTFVVAIMLSLGFIGVAVYGNIQAGEGLDVAIVAVKKGNHTFGVMLDRMSQVHSSYDHMHQSFNDTVTMLPDQEFLDNVESDLNALAEKLDQAEQPLSDVEEIMNLSVYVVVTGENYRKVATLSLLGFQCLLCFFGLLGICCRSKWMVVVMIVFGIICVIGTCFYLGADLSISVGLSDFCIDPLRSLQNYTVDEDYLTVNQTDYFLFCRNPDKNLLRDELAGADGKLREYQGYIARMSEENITQAEQDSLTRLNESIAAFERQLNDAVMSFGCEATSAAARKFSSAICRTTVEGFFALAVAIFAMTVCMSVMICAAASAGGRYSDKMSRSSSFDYSDPFLPHNSNYNSNSNRNITRTNNPIYATSTSSTTNLGVMTNTLSFFRPGSDEDDSLLDSPPPYSPPRNAR